MSASGFAPLSKTLSVQRFGAMCSALGDLPMGQKIALLTMRRGDIAMAVLERLKARGTPSPTMRDFSDLVFATLAVQRPGSRFHRLTPIGFDRANTLAREMARDLGIHKFIAGQNRFYFTFRCTCGEFSVQHARNEGYSAAALDHYKTQHLNAVAAKERVTA